MSVTLGELLQGNPMTLHSPPSRILNNMGQEVEVPYSSKLQKRDYTKSTSTYDEPPVVAQHPGEGVPYTLIDSTPILNPHLPPPQPGALFGDQNQQLHYNPHQGHSSRIDDLMPYSAMGPYNSNRINQDFQYIVGPTPAGMALQQAQHSQVMVDGNGVRYAMGPDGRWMTLPREHSFEDIANAQKAGIQQYATFAPYPGMAGGVPLMQNAVASDQAVMMGGQGSSRFSRSEGFQPRGHDMSCNAALHHMMTCPVCSKYMQCDNKMYVMMMILLIIIFSILLYMAMKNGDK